MKQIKRSSKQPISFRGTKYVLSLLLTGLLTTLGWLFFRFLGRVWQQPGLTAVHFELPPDEDISVREQAMLIATGNVVGAIEERAVQNSRQRIILNAGWRNFREPWARDFGFASFGLLEINQTHVVRETLELFLHFQRASGQFPVKVHSTNVVERYIYAFFKRQQPIYAPLRPKYLTAHRTISLDGNALLVIAALNYLRRVEDMAFVEEHWLALKEGLHWLESKALGGDGLLHQGAYTDWADSVKRTGIIHYTNVLYWKALHEFAIDGAKYGFTAESKSFEAQANLLKEAINDHFWDETAGFYRTSSQFSDILSTSGNVLAVAWGLAEPEQGHRILDTMQALGMADPVPTQVTSQPYPNGNIAIENRLGGIGHYHTSAAWLWLGAWHVVACCRIGRLDEAKTLLNRMSEIIVREGVVHEVYGEDGRFISTRWYTSEAPLTWSASLFVYANAYYQHTVEESGSAGILPAKASQST